MVINEIAIVQLIAQLVTSPSCHKITLRIGQFGLICGIILARCEEHQIVRVGIGSCGILSRCLVLWLSRRFLLLINVLVIVGSLLASFQELLVGALFPVGTCNTLAIHDFRCVKSLILPHFLLHYMLHYSRIECLTSFFIWHMQFFWIVS